MNQIDNACLEAIYYEAFCHGKDRREKNSRKWGHYDDPEILGMGIADMDFQCPPPVLDAMKDILDEGMLSYHKRPESFYKEIIDRYARYYHCMVKREWINHGPGIFPSIRLCIQTFAKRGDTIITQSPYFNPVKVVVESCGCRLITNPMILKDNHYEIDFQDFEEKIKCEKPVIYILVNPHNPTGRVFSRNELARLKEICTKYDVLMISDEVHENITYGDHRHIPLVDLTIENNEKCIVVTAPSKGYNLMDLTLCLLIIPNDVLSKKFKNTMDGYTFNFATNVFSIVGTQVAYSEKCDLWLKVLNDYLEENVQEFVEQLKEVEGIVPIFPEGGYMIWLDCRKLGKSPSELKYLFLEKAKLDLSWGENFGSNGEGFERINIACSKATLKEAIERIKYTFNPNNLLEFSKKETVENNC